MEINVQGSNKGHDLNHVGVAHPQFDHMDSRGALILVPISMTDRSPKTASVSNDPLSVIVQDRSNQRVICDHLEQIADQLGGSVNRDLCHSVLQSLESDLPLYHLDEELFFSVLCSQDESDRALAKYAELATAEHRLNETYFFELAEPLSDIGAGGTLYNINTVGYMLRCCFEGLRRHLNWEDTVILDGRLETLTAPGLRTLEAGLARNRSKAQRHLKLSR